MPEVFDLDALARESAGEPFRFRFGGDDYELPASIDVRAVALLEKGQLHDFMSTLLGSEQWQRMLASPATFDNRVFEALIEGYGAHLGMELGKSSGSTGSSASTAAPSKPTSNGSTVFR
jgi:hypothetical protein